MANFKSVKFCLTLFSFLLPLEIGSPKAHRWTLAQSLPALVFFTPGLLLGIGLHFFTPFCFILTSAVAALNAYAKNAVPETQRLNDIRLMQLPP